MLCMPISFKRTKTVTVEDGMEREEPFAYTHFAYKPHWFVISQTDGADYVPAANPEWNEERTLAAMQIERVQFEMLNGNTQGLVSACLGSRRSMVQIHSPRFPQSVDLVPRFSIRLIQSLRR